MAAGLIAQQCSRFEARIAGAGKEFTDLFTGGDPSWSDWKADRAGIQCAEVQNDREGLASCCIAAGY